LLQLGEECRAIEDKIRAARFREKLRFRSRWAARPDDLLQALHEDDPAVLHFSGHGAGAQGLCFLAEDGGVFCVNSDGLGQVIRAAGDSIQLVVLNACYTRVQAEALVAHVPCVIGMPSAIGDKSAIVYAAELYRALAFGKSVASAHQCGLAALALHSMAGNMRDIDIAEAVLRTVPPELLVRTGVDAGYVHIVQGAPPTTAVPASSGESRIHLEIDIDADFETLDASTLSKLVSEICRLSGGRPVRILCVTKGSIRLHLSFEPDAARALMSLRDSGRLNCIGGFRVSNVVDLGQVESSPQALDHADTSQPPSDPVIEIEDVSTTAGSKRDADPPDLVPALTIVSHPVAQRAGEQLPLDTVAAGGKVILSRNAHDFTRPGRVLGQPLGDPFVARKPLRFGAAPGGGVRVTVDPGTTPVVTARLASVARLDEIVDTVLNEIVGLGFDAVWVARLDEPSGMLVTLKSVVDGVDFTDQMPKIWMLDMRQPVGHGFREGRMVNVTDPDSLYIIEHEGDAVPPGRMALPRAVYNQLRGHPFACGPLFGSRGQPVGAFCVSSYRGNQPIPDELLTQGLVRTFTDHLGIAMERAMHLEQLQASPVKASEAIANDARIKAVGELASPVAHDLLPRIERTNRAIGDLQQTIEDILIMVKPLLHERSIEVDAALPAVPAVRCDPVLVHQVVLNLVMNAHDALDAVPPDQRRIRIELRDDDGVVRVTVADTGPGIAPAVLAQLFRPFITTKRDAHLGLGLAAARAALQHFGANIEGRNAPAGGAVFEVSLVAAPPETPTAKRLHPPRPTEHAPPRFARILAIDDDPDVVDIIGAYLEPHGHAVATATTSAEALEIAAAQAFDLVLCDIGMPKQNGIDVCRTLRDIGYRGKLVLMTGWENYELSDEQRAVGFDNVIKKPFLGADLLAVIERVLTLDPRAVGASRPT
jgi:CheY-like chemotaxis protein